MIFIGRISKKKKTNFIEWSLRPIIHGGIYKWRTTGLNGVLYHTYACSTRRKILRNPYPPFYQDYWVHCRVWKSRSWWRGDQVWDKKG